MPSLNIGTKAVYLVCIGNTQVKKIYVGSNLVYTAPSTRIPNNLTTYTDIYNAMVAAGLNSLNISVNGVTHTLQKSTNTTNKLKNNVNSNTYSFAWSSTSSGREMIHYIAADMAGYLYVQTTIGKQYYIKKFQYTSSGTYSLKNTYAA